MDDFQHTADMPRDGDAKPSLKPARSVPNDSLRHAERVASYSVLKTLGQGGMGVVYLCEQTNPKRQVALKVIRPDFVTDELLRRFEYEAQVLAMLQHRGIAQIYEAGMEEREGRRRPFFAMEYVKGRSLGAYAERAGLDTRDRLTLFIEICLAVQHAHQRGIIHRDLKPANILVTDEGQPKILDFGVARATDADVQTATMQTEAGQLVGTLPYMSPEQIAGDATALDTRSDIYALGVILYELLAGRRPHDLAKQSITQAIQTLTQSRAAPLSSVDRRLGGDVQTIVDTAMASDRERRYASAADMGADLRRYLHDEPIEARPPSSVYLMRKFAKRNRALVMGLAGVFLVLVAAAAVSNRLMIDAQAARGQAVIEREAAERARGQAEAEAQRATAISAFLTEELLGSANPKIAQGRDITVGEVLDTASVRAAAMTEQSPRAAIEVRSAIGSIYHSLGDYDNARVHYEAVETAATELWGEHDPNTFEARRSVTSVLSDQGELELAEKRARQNLEDMLAALDADDPDLAFGEAELGRVLIALGRHEEAEQRLRSGIEIASGHFQATDERVLTIRHNLATLLKNMSRYEECEAMWAELIELRERAYGPNHPDTLGSKNNLATSLAQRGALDEAEPVLMDVLERRLDVLGEDHPSTTATRINLSQLLIRRGRYEQARPLLVSLVELNERTLGEDHPTTLTALNNLAFTLEDLGELEEAERMYRRALAGRERVIGPKHPETLALVNNLASLLERRGDLQAAAAMFARAVDGARETMGDEHIYTAIFRNNSAPVLVELGRFEQAERELLASQPVIESTFGPEHDRSKKGRSRLVDLYEAWDRPADAERYRKDSEAEVLSG